MTEEELTEIRLRDTRADPNCPQALHDRRALIAELDRVRSLWEECRTHCFDPSETKPPFRAA